MTNYNFGEILLLKFPHSEGKGVSKKPVVVLAQVIEDYALVQLIKENEKEETLNIDQAKEYYNKLEKTK